MDVKNSAIVWIPIAILGVITVFYGMNKTGEISLFPSLMILFLLVLPFRPAFKYHDKSIGYYNPLGMRLKSWNIEELIVVDETGGAKTLYGKRKNKSDKKNTQHPKPPIRSRSIGITNRCS
ncbi:MAG: hypothetical protein ABJ327_24335 [Litoreibacter sp.]